MHQASPPIADTQRLDTWLWAARFYKTRSLAKEAIEGGKVRLNGHPAKPAAKVRPGDELDVNRAGEHMQVRVVALNTQRRPASEAQRLYVESAESLARREGERELRRLAGGTPAPSRKPDSHAREALRRLRGKA
ncbi:MAG: RNA-binding S4 domain-containing protein [Gammaproteobacteria bacterium]|nr:RNA-binding S4 domain-containing protein [Gammaproteobacteria bacterium]